MSFDAFLKIATIPGESKDAAHADEIEVIDYDLGVWQPKSAVMSSAGSMTTQRADFNNFSFVHALDASSPKLFLACAKGEHIADAVLSLHRADGTKQKYMEYKMTDVVVASVKPGGNSKGEQNLPTETVELNYGRIDLTYTKTNNQGAPVGDVKTWWNRSDNTGG